VQRAVVPGAHAVQLRGLQHVPGARLAACQTPLTRTQQRRPRLRVLSAGPAWKEAPLPWPFPFSRPRQETGNLCTAASASARACADGACRHAADCDALLHTLRQRRGARARGAGDRGARGPAAAPAPPGDRAGGREQRGLCVRLVRRHLCARRLRSALHPRALRRHWQTCTAFAWRNLWRCGALRSIGLHRIAGWCMFCFMRWIPARTTRPAQHPAPREVQSRMLSRELPTYGAPSSATTVSVRK